MTRKEMMSKSRRKSKHYQISVVLRVLQKLQPRIRVRSIKEQLSEYAARGSMKAVCRQLVKADEQCLLKDRNVVFDMFATSAQNFHVQKNGKTYKMSVQMFYEVLVNWGGPRLANVVAINITRPESHSVYQWRNQHKVTLTCGLDEGNFKALRSVFSKLKDNLPCVPVIMAEDDTDIVPNIHYNQEQDKLEGFCGVKGVNPKCLDRLEVEFVQNQWDQTQHFYT